MEGSTPEPTGEGFWYLDVGSGLEPVDVLNLLRRYREAERRMRLRTRDSMGMGETDLVALRFLLRAARAGRRVRQRDLAETLEITGASASALVDRLIRDGYAQRVAHPEDRRSVAIEPTVKSDEDVRATLGAMHQRMLAAAESLTPAELAGAAKFLTALTRSLE
jgi:DNA-binding MarR family transcriptional regulator